MSFSRLGSVDTRSAFGDTPPPTPFGAVKPNISGLFGSRPSLPSGSSSTLPCALQGYIAPENVVQFKTERISGHKDFTTQAEDMGSNSAPANSISQSAVRQKAVTNMLSSRSASPEEEVERFGLYQPINQTAAGFDFAALSSAPMPQGEQRSQLLAGQLSAVQAVENAQPPLPPTTAISSIAAPDSQVKRSAGVAFGSPAIPRASGVFSRGPDPNRPAAWAVKRSPKKNPMSFSGIPVFVNFEIGPDAQVFTVHKQLAMLHSPYFKKVFASVRGQDPLKTFPLPRTDTPTFGLLVHYLYTEKIEDQSCTLAERSVKNPDMKLCSDPLQLVKLWLIAQHCQITALQNLIIPRLITILSRSSNKSIETVANLVFLPRAASPGRSIEEPSHIQDLLVDHTAFSPRSVQPQQQPSGESYQSLMNNLPGQMVSRIAVRLRGVYDTTLSKTVGGQVVMREADYIVGPPTGDEGGRI